MSWLNGPSPVAAYASTDPSEKTSPGGPIGSPLACSGHMKPGEPTTIPVLVSLEPSSARAIPKSITRGPSVASRTLEGLRSRWTSPAAWMAPSASASPAPSARTVSAGSGPCAATASVSEGPST